MNDTNTTYDTAVRDADFDDFADSATAVTGTILHLVEPLGFNLRDTKLRRAGLDYHDMAHVVLHPNFEDLVELMPDSRIIAFTAHATKLYTDIEYRPTDILLFGPEPGNIPDPMDIMAGPHVAEQVRLPMRPSLRSLNLTNCASIRIILQKRL